MLPSDSMMHQHRVGIARGGGRELALGMHQLGGRGARPGSLVAACGRIEPLAVRQLVTDGPNHAASLHMDGPLSGTTCFYSVWFKEPKCQASRTPSNPSGPSLPAGMQVLVGTQPPSSTAAPRHIAACSDR